MGLLDWIIGWFFFTPIRALLWCIPRRGVFFVFLLPKTGSVVQRSSKGRVFFVTCPGPENVTFAKSEVTERDLIRN